MTVRTPRRVAARADWADLALVLVAVGALLLALFRCVELGMVGVAGLLGGIVLGLLFLVRLVGAGDDRAHPGRPRELSTVPSGRRVPRNGPGPEGAGPRNGDALPDRVPARARPAGPPPAASPARPAAVRPAPDDPRAAVLGGGSSAGRAPWYLPAGPAQSGIAADAATVGDLRVRAASVVGAAHRCMEADAVARQDAYAIARSRSGAHLIVAVADGLSDSPRSELGARVAVSAAVRVAVQQLGPDEDMAALAAPVLFRSVAGEMVGTARERNLRDADVCSLLVVAVVPARPGRDGGRRVWTAQVGDVSLWLHGPGGWQQRTGGLKSGLDRNAVSDVLPFAGDQVTDEFVDVPPGHGVAVLTDGFGDLLTDVAGAREYFGHRWESPPDPAAFVADVNTDAPGQTDDRTAVVVWCGGRS